jgi:hypothetical protein
MKTTTHSQHNAETPAEYDDDRPAEGSTCILACAFGFVVLCAMVATALWMVNK